MLKNLKSSCISVKFSQISALIGFIGFVAFCIYAALFKYCLLYTSDAADEL